jgi:hypothetical protein
MIPSLQRYLNGFLLNLLREDAQDRTYIYMTKPELGKSLQPNSEYPRADGSC